jgi:GNAT superfamily N-acetyltransferase
MATFKVSFATESDIELLVQHRVNMWIAIRPNLKQRSDKMVDVTRDWIKKMLSEKRMIGFIARAEESTVVAGSGCIWLSEEQPRFIENQLYSPLLISMYTEEKFRRKGVASMIVQRAIDWSKENGYNMINLQASEEGAPVYEQFGFKPTREMRLILRAKTAQ